MRKKIVAKTLLLPFMIATVCLVGFSIEKNVDSIWTESPVNIDGVSDDWVDNSLNFEKKVKVDYAFKNDANSLYVLFIFKNLKYLTTIKGTGMTLWLSTEGKKKKKYGINFRMKRVTADELVSVLEKQKGPLPEADKKRIKSRPHYFLYQSDVIDKKGNILTASALGGELEAPVFRSKEDQKTVVYEFRMPLKIFEKLSADQGIEPGKIVKVGFEWGGLTKEMKAARMKKLATSKPQTHKPVSLVESGAEGEESSGTGSAQMRAGRKGPPKYSFWVDVKLAQM